MRQHRTSVRNCAPENPTLRIESGRNGLRVCALHSRPGMTTLTGVSGLNLICLQVQPSRKKYFALPVGQIISTSSRHPASIRGTYRDRHERGVRDAVDANCIARRAFQFADGEVVWSWRLDAGVKLATMLRIALAMVTRKPDHQREHGISRKTIRAGKAGSFRPNLW